MTLRQPHRQAELLLTRFLGQRPTDQIDYMQSSVGWVLKAYCDPKDVRWRSRSPLTESTNVCLTASGTYVGSARSGERGWVREVWLAYWGVGELLLVEATRVGRMSWRFDYFCCSGIEVRQWERWGRLSKEEERYIADCRDTISRECQMVVMDAEMIL